MIKRKHVTGKGIVEWEVPDEVIEGQRERNTEALRAARNAKLTETDWTQLPDIDGDVKFKAQQYRQKLRDWTLTPEFKEAEENITLIPPPED